MLVNTPLGVWDRDLCRHPRCSAGFSVSHQQTYFQDRRLPLGGCKQVNAT